MFITCLLAVTLSYAPEEKIVETAVTGVQKYKINGKWLVIDFERDARKRGLVFDKGYVQVVDEELCIEGKE